MISRRGFFGLMCGFAAAEVARKIYVLPPMGGWNISPGEALFYLPEDKWSYRYTYKNIVTGHVSDATAYVTGLKHMFGYPEVDLVDINRRLAEMGMGFNLHRTVGVWGING